MNLKRPVWFVIVLSQLCLAFGLPAADLSESAERMLADVKELASDEYEGRGVGTKGL